MFGGMLVLRACVLVVCCLGPLGAVAEARPVVSDVRTGQHDNFTRLVLDVSAPVSYDVFTLDNPYRVVIDLSNVEWQADIDPDGQSGLIRGLRYGQFTADVSRVVLDTAGPVEVHRAFLLPALGAVPFRFVVDLQQVDRAAFVRTAMAVPPAAFRPPKPIAKPRHRDDRPVVVIDPGHGGVDPGTIGISGIYEKNVTLHAARELKAALEAGGRYRVVLTRNTDIFVRLRDRVAIARRAGADLFVSLHADSIKDHRFRGATVYTLSERASDAEAQALAAKENKADIIAGVDFNGRSDEVTSILIDLAQRETMNYSASFANLLIEEIGRDWRLLRKGHRFAGFAVLKAPDVPAALVELGYLSNRHDESALRSAAGRRKLVDAIARGIDRYFLSSPR